MRRRQNQSETPRLRSAPSAPTRSSGIHPCGHPGGSPKILYGGGQTGLAVRQAAGVRSSRWLAAFAIAVVVGHHLGTIVGPFGEVGGQTEWADWVDLATPYVVVGTALGALLAAAAPRRAWLLAALGAVVYVQGHGIHLAANSVSNARGSAAPVHLWDEVMGHYVWYGGLYLLVAALVLAVPEPTGAARWPLAVLFGFTMATNGIEGGTALFTLCVAVAFVAWGVRRHSAVVVTTWAVAAVLLAGWGIYWAAADGRFFPQFSELGWI